MKERCIFSLFVFLLSTVVTAQQVNTVVADSGWAGNSVNTVVFRKNALVTHQQEQYISFYNTDGAVMVGKRTLGSSQWQLVNTGFKGRIRDAHNSISIMADGDGFLHLAWDHHNNALHYAKTVAPGSLTFSAQQPMTGTLESNVTYPEFYRMPTGDLLFFYRDGQSGQGNLVINRYVLKEKKWIQLQQNLISGEQQRNAYWQAAVDQKGVIHLSWVWRESSDVASNHDLCYAKSTDGGTSWTTSSGLTYQLPITASTAEYVARIPQKSELINQTSMTVREDGIPFIAGYWRSQDDPVPQYQVVYLSTNGWKTINTGFRKTAFSLSGAGTKRIPIARPQVLVQGKGKKTSVRLLFRDEERGSKVSVAVCKNLRKNNWQLIDFTDYTVGSWEPLFDTELWKQKKQLHIFIQYTEQADAEGTTLLPAQPVKVLELTFKK